MTTNKPYNNNCLFNIIIQMLQINWLHILLWNTYFKQIVKMIQMNWYIQLYETNIKTIIQMPYDFKSYHKYHSYMYVNCTYNNMKQILK